MKVRDFYFGKAQGVSDSSSTVFLLPRGLKIQNIRIKVGSTNGATSNTVGKLNGMVTKIEVLDGSDIWYSASFPETQAYNFYETLGKLPRKNLSAGAAVVIFEEAVMNFGRYMYDPYYYLDTARLIFPFIRVTVAMTISATAGFATGTTTVSAIARIIDDGANPYKGCMMTKEFESFSILASGDDPNILPLDWPYHSILVQAISNGIAPDTSFTNFKLLLNGGLYIPFDMTGTDVLSWNQDVFGYGEEDFRPLSDTSFTWQSDLWSDVGAWYSRPGATAKGIVSTAAANTITGTSTTGQAADGTQITVKGLSPFGSFFLPFGDPRVWDPADFLNPKGLAEIRLLKTQGNAAGTGTVTIKQLRM